MQLMVGYTRAPPRSGGYLLVDFKNEQSPTCEVVHETKLTSEISFPTDSCPAQLSDHWSYYPEVVSSNPTEGNF